LFGSPVVTTLARLGLQGAVRQHTHSVPVGFTLVADPVRRWQGCGLKDRRRLLTRPARAKCRRKRGPLVFDIMGQATRRFRFRRQPFERIQTIVAREREH
jgi:hypothetical protein